MTPESIKIVRKDEKKMEKEEEEEEEKEEVKWRLTGRAVTKVKRPSDDYDNFTVINSFFVYFSLLLIATILL